MERRPQARGKTPSNLPIEKRTVPVFGGITLAVNDMEKSMSYYRDVLGFDVDLSNPFRAAVLSEGGAILGLFSAKQFGGSKEPIVPTPFPFHLEFEVEDLDGLYQRVTKAGYSASKPAFGPWGGKAFFTKDPDGYNLQFHGLG